MIQICGVSGTSESHIFLNKKRMANFMTMFGEMYSKNFLNIDNSDTNRRLSGDDSVETRYGEENDTSKCSYPIMLYNLRMNRFSIETNIFCAPCRLFPQPAHNQSCGVSTQAGHCSFSRYLLFNYCSQATISFQSIGEPPQSPAPRWCILVTNSC